MNEKQRIKGRRFALIYPPNGLPKEVILTKLQEIREIETYVIGEEGGGLLTNRRVHCLIILKKELDTRNCNYFDIDENHPSIEKIGRKDIDLERVYFSIKKEDKEPLSNLVLKEKKNQEKDYENEELNKLEDLDKKLTEITVSQSSDEALKYLIKNHPETAAKGISSYKRNLTVIDKLKKKGLELEEKIGRRKKRIVY